MLNLADYCTPNSIRAVLGVSAEEIEDATISDQIYVITLSERFNDLDPDLVPAFAALSPKPPTVPTELRFYELMQTYAAYIMAQQMLASVKMFAPQIITDSKAATTRIADPFKDLRDNIQGSLNYFGTRIEAAYLALNPSAVVTAPVTRVFAATVPIGFDPVLNQ